MDRLDGIEPQSIDVILANPVQRILDDVAPDLLTALIVVVDRVTPYGVVAVSKIWTELAEVIAFRSDVVVHDIQHHR